MSEHAPWSPSRLPYLDLCPRFLGGAPGAPALRGTSIDSVVSSILSGDLVEIPEEIEAQVTFAVEAVEAARAELGEPCEVYVQRRLDTPIPGCWGTADVLLVNDFEGTGIVLDTKSGWSDRGPAGQHLQLLAYASGAAQEFGLHTVAVRLVEVDRREVRTAILEREALAAIPQRLADVIRRVKAAKPGDETPGGYCSWCVRSVTCPAVSSTLAPVAEAAAATPKDYAEALTPLAVGDFLTTWLARAELMETIVSSVKARAHAILEAGGEVPGWTLVNGRKTRRWEHDEDAEVALVEKLGDGAFVRKLRSPAQVEKVAKDDPSLKELVKKLSVAVPSRTLAPQEAA